MKKDIRALKKGILGVSPEYFGDAIHGFDLPISAQETIEALEELLGVDGAGAHGRNSLEKRGKNGEKWG